jgi:hypothetical protein
MSKNLYLPQDRYVAVLRRQRERIANGLPFQKEDSDRTGDKYTHASWGLCTEDGAAWPADADRLWPDMGRTTPKYRKADQKCPMDTRDIKQIAGTGCFFTCRIFTAKTVKAKDRDKAVRLYDVELARFPADPHAPRPSLTDPGCEA